MATDLPPEEVARLHRLPVNQVVSFWDAAEMEGRRQGKFFQTVRVLCLADLYYLLVRVCGRVDMLPKKGDADFIGNEFAFNRCREVEKSPDGHLDLWARW